MMPLVLSRDSGTGFLEPDIEADPAFCCSGRGSMKGSRSLMVRHVVHRKTFRPCGHRTVESHVMHLPVTGCRSGLAGLVLLAGVVDLPFIGSSSVATASLLLGRAACFFSLRLELKKAGKG
jgi:hypothetical protein